MAFRRLKNKNKRKKESIKSPLLHKQNKDTTTTSSHTGRSSEIEHISATATQTKSINNDKSIRHKLYKNKAEGMAEVATWIPLFSACWLVSGIVLNNIPILSLCALPLIIINMIARSRDNRTDSIPFYKELEIFELIISLLCPLLLWHWYSLSELAVISLLANLAYYYLHNKKRESVPDALFRSLLRFIFPGLLAQAGILSQLEIVPHLETSKEQSIYLGYIILGIVPGSLLASRELLLHHHIFDKAGWKLQIEKTNSKGEKFIRPGAFTKLAVITMILGPAIPALQLPFRILPDTFLLASLSFLVLPKVAEKIQDSSKNYPFLCIHLANLATALGVLMFIAALLAKHIA